MINLDIWAGNKSCKGKQIGLHERDWKGALFQTEQEL